MPPRITYWLLILVLPLLGCRQYRDDLDYEYTVEYAWSEPEVPGQLSLFEGVHWEPAYARAVRPLLTDQSLVSNRKVLDLFGGPGTIAVMCASENAQRVLSLAESKAAEACARYNVAASAEDSIVTVRFADLSSPHLLGKAEKFDVILATLAGGDAERLSQQIDFALNCLQNHLALSGRAFVVCEDEQTAALLKTASEPLGWLTKDVGSSKEIVCVAEMIDQP